MKTEIVHIVFSIFALTIAAAAQELFPAFGGAKPPFLLMVALCAAMRPDPPDPDDGKSDRSGGLRGWLLVAAAAGLFADALDALPFGCATAFAVIACSAARFLRGAAGGIPSALVGFLAGAIAAPCQEAWFDLWLPAAGAASTLVRFFASALPASIAGAALFAAIPAIAWRIGLDGEFSAEGGREA